MLTAAVGPGNVRSQPSLWDGTTDSGDQLVLPLDLQAGDVVQATLTYAGAGIFQWTCTARDGDIGFLADPTGYFFGSNPADLEYLHDVFWVVPFVSNRTQTVRIGVDHRPVPAGQILIAGAKVAVPAAQYRLAHVTLSASVIGRMYA